MLIAQTLNKLRTLPRDARDTLFLLLIIAWVILPHVQHLPLWCSVISAGVMIWRGVLAWRGKPLPAKGWLIALLLVVVAATWLTHRTLAGKDAGVTLIVALLTLKTLELRAKRDAFVVFFLGFFTMLTNFFFSQSLLVAAAMLIALMGLLTALVHSHRLVGQPPLKESFKQASILVLLGSPIMLLLFVLFPRLAPLWGMPGETNAARSGLSQEMRVGDMASVALDEAVAFRLKWQLTPGQSEPAQNQMYFRGPVLSAFDGRTWRPADGLIARRYQLPANLRTTDEILSYEITMEPTRNPWIYVLEAATEKPQLSGQELFMTPELQWRSNQAVSDLIRYSAKSSVTFRHGPELMTTGMQTYLDLPPSFNPRTLALAWEIRRDPRFARAGAEALVPEVLRRLSTGGYSYTLEPGVYGEHVADEFWFDRKEGFCEHFASAFVILMRALDVPARVVTGYQGGEKNAVDRYWTVRQSDAHAWAEVWQAGVGWVRVDPTAAVAPGRIGSFSRLVQPRGAVGEAVRAALPRGLIVQLRSAWEAVNNNWNQWVLNYSQKKQLDLLKNIGFESPSWTDLGKVLAGLIALAALIGSAFIYWERQHIDPWQRLLQQSRQRLELAGLALPAALPPRGMAAKALAHWGAAAEPVHDWLIDLERQRYAGDARDAPLSLKSLAQRLKQLPALQKQTFKPPIAH